MINNRIIHLLLLLTLLAVSLALYRFTLSISDGPFKAVMMPVSGVLGAAGVAWLFQLLLITIHKYCSRRFSGGKNAG